MKFDFLNTTKRPDSKAATEECSILDPGVLSLGSSSLFHETLIEHVLLSQPDKDVHAPNKIC